MFRFVKSIFSSPTMATTEVSELVSNLIREHKVMVFSKSYCPYCHKAKQALNSIGAEYHAIELDTRSDGSAIQDSLLALTGQRTVPNVFINGRSIGGGDDTARLAKSGELRRLIDAEV